MKTSTTAALLIVAALAIGRADAQLASPLSTPLTDRITQGEVVFADLLTTDVDGAGRFYSDLLGWEIRRSEDQGYIELVHAGSVIGAIAAFEEDAEPGNARWLPSISVRDIDATIQTAASLGGEVLEAPMDFPKRGRLAVIQDPQGAVLMLLRSSSGDPERPDQAGGFGWAELWASDVAVAVDFYEGVFGYRALKAPSSPDMAVLTIDGTAHATIVAIPGDDIEPNWLPYVPVTNARAMLESVARLGGSVLATSDEVDGAAGSFAAIIADPTGGVFAIQDQEGIR